MRPVQPASRSTRSGFIQRRKALRLAAALPWVVVLVAGCGQKGSLYHPPGPDEEDEDSRTSTVPGDPGSAPA